MLDAIGFCVVEVVGECGRVGHIGISEPIENITGRNSSTLLISIETDLSISKILFKEGDICNGHIIIPAIFSCGPIGNENIYHAGFPNLCNSAEVFGCFSCGTLKVRAENIEGYGCTGFRRVDLGEEEGTSNYSDEEKNN